MSVDARLAGIVSRAAREGWSGMIYLIAEKRLLDHEMDAWCGSHLGPGHGTACGGSWRAERLVETPGDLRHSILVLSFRSDADALVFHLRWGGDKFLTRLGAPWDRMFA